MAYISPLLTAVVGAVKKSASSMDRDFSELEQLQNSVRGNKNFVFGTYSRIEKNLKAELAKIRPDMPMFTPNDKVVGDSYFAISPIEGLINFAHGNPDFAVSVALVENGAIICAVVYNPARDETFFAEKGKGAYKEGYRNHERLRVSAVKELDGALISATSSYAENIAEASKLHAQIAAKPATCASAAALLKIWLIWPAAKPMPLSVLTTIFAVLLPACCWLKRRAARFAPLSKKTFALKTYPKFSKPAIWLP